MYSTSQTVGNIQYISNTVNALLLNIRNQIISGFKLDTPLGDLNVTFYWFSNIQC